MPSGYSRESRFRPGRGQAGGTEPAKCDGPVQGAAESFMTACPWLRSAVVRCPAFRGPGFGAETGEARVRASGVGAALKGIARRSARTPALRPARGLPGYRRRHTFDGTLELYFGRGNPPGQEERLRPARGGQSFPRSTAYSECGPAVRRVRQPPAIPRACRARRFRPGAGPGSGARAARC